MIHKPFLSLPLISVNIMEQSVSFILRHQSCRALEKINTVTAESRKRCESVGRDVKNETTFLTLTKTFSLLISHSADLLQLHTLIRGKRTAPRSTSRYFTQEQILFFWEEI